MFQLSIYMYLFFFKSFSHLGYYRILTGVPCAIYIVGPCRLSILNMVICTCQSQTPSTTLNTFKCQHCAGSWVKRTSFIAPTLAGGSSPLVPPEKPRSIGSQAKEHVPLNLRFMLHPGLCQIPATRAYSSSLKRLEAKIDTL